ncbi:Glutamate--cysteine ligase [Venturia inaequalis]|nr:Glutamate--cysteine ligase [Venturia inaequalis]
MTRHTPFLCNHCFKWNTSYTLPICWQCKRPKADTCFPNPTLLLGDQYVFTVDEYREHSEFPIRQREELRTLKDAYDNAVAQEAKGTHASPPPTRKLRALFKGGRGAEEQENVHGAYLARKREIMDRKEDIHFLEGVEVEKPALNGRVTGDAWQMKLSTLIIDVPCIETLNTKLSDRVGVLLAFLMDLNAIPGGNEVTIILDDRRALNIHDCARLLSDRGKRFDKAGYMESSDGISSQLSRDIHKHICPRNSDLPMK